MYSLLKHCLILAFYPYTSAVRDTIYNVDNQTRDGMNYRSFEDLADLFRNSYYVQQKDKTWKSGMGQWDNKVVLKCQSADGNIFYVGKLDGRWSIGLGVHDMDDNGALPCLREDKLYCIIKEGDNLLPKLMSEVEAGDDVIFTSSSIAHRLLNLKKLKHIGQ